MGEAFKRARAEAFTHKRHRGHQELADGDLFRLSRGSESDRVIKTRLTGDDTGLSVGSPCIVTPSSDGRLQVVHGNTPVSVLSQEAADVVLAVFREAPSLNNILPCTIADLGPFRGVTLKPEAGGRERE
jgi:hypothetical protein